MNVILPDIPRVYTALAEWGACMVYVLFLERRLRGWRLWTWAGALLALLAAFLVLTGELPVVLWIPCMMAALGMMLLLVATCCRLAWRDALYYTVQAFVLAEFAASLEWQLHCFLLLEKGSPALPSAALLLGIYLFCFLGVGWLLRRFVSGPGYLNVTWWELGSAVIIGLSEFAASNLSFLSVQTPFTSQYSGDIYNIRTIMDLGGLAILYAHHVQCHDLRVRRELEAVQIALRTQYQQYQLSRESIDLINRKYHDLKHQITVLRAEPDSAKRSAFLDQMEEEIRVYEAQNKTGNQILDTILTSKSLYCARNGISLTCVVDGALLDFMEPMDLSAVFGNALDNAIECEEGVADREKRLIHVTVSARQGFVLVRFENYCEGSLHFDGGLPVTTKADTDYHGYGLKSIRFVVKKYGGSVTARMEEPWFVLQLLLPQGNTGSAK